MCEILQWAPSPLSSRISSGGGSSGATMQSPRTIPNKASCATSPLIELLGRLCNCSSCSSRNTSSSSSNNSGSSNNSPSKLVGGGGGSSSRLRSALAELRTDSNIEVCSPLKLTSPTKLLRMSPSSSPSSSPHQAILRSRSGKRSFNDSATTHAVAGVEDYDPEPAKENEKVRFLKQQHSIAMALSPLKRKRPPKLQIPTESSSDGNAGLRSMREKKAVPGEFSEQNRCYGVYSKRGHREVLEDAYRAILDIDNNPQQAFFGIFDGHGGRRAAEFAAAHLSQNISEALSNGATDLESAVRLGYLTTDAAFIAMKASSGTSCVTVSVMDHSLVVANAGDCRAVMSKSGTAVALTEDHRLGREDERRRVEDLGAYVDCFSGVWRLQGALAVSRGIGDIHLKEWVSAEPEIRRFPVSGDCEFLVLASDGLWDVVSNQEAVDVIRPELRNGAGLLHCSKKLVELAASRGSMDDVSVLVVDLRCFMRL